MAQRIDGWKSIGGHFGRDRTTAMRWAETRGLPVHRVPGGKRASVYAFREELDAWLRTQRGALDDAATEPPKSRPRRRIWIASALFLLVLLLVVAGAGTWLAWRAPGTAMQLPRDSDVARLYLQARDDWAQRTSSSIDRAIATLGEVTRRQPDFAPAQASLAEAWLLAREFGSRSDQAAFPQAMAAADRALALDGGLHAAHRAKGFILYWWQHRPEAADAAFKRALALAPRDAQTHFWYGNALSDNGSHEAALRELDAARLLEPGSVAIQTDLAWAYWAAGRRDEAMEMLERLRAASPEFAVVHECIGHIRLADGDYAGYVAAFEQVARLRRNRELLTEAAGLHAALAQGLPALRQALMRAAEAHLAEDPGQNRAWAAFLASTARDRARLLALLRQAHDRGERWGAAGFASRIEARWSADPQVSALLRAVRQPRMQ